MNGAGVSTGFAETLQRISNVKAKVLNEYLRPHVGFDSNFVLPILVRPKSKGELRLRSSFPFDPPIIQPNYLNHPDDLRALIEGQ
jgi:choline dehydrogenase-like flavoprotein